MKCLHESLGTQYFLYFLQDTPTDDPLSTDDGKLPYEDYTSDSMTSISKFKSEN